MGWCMRFCVYVGVWIHKQSRTQGQNGVAHADATPGLAAPESYEGGSVARSFGA